MPWLPPFAAAGRFYKGNLHTHSTRSDGARGPAEVCAAYCEAGYDFLALTDHFLPRFGGRLDDGQGGSLEPEALLAALRNGHSYATQGPDIHTIGIDGEDVVVECNPASAVMLVGRASAHAVVFGSGLCQARLSMACLERGGYGRIVVADAAGKRAWSNPFRRVWSPAVPSLSGWPAVSRTLRWLA